MEESRLALRQADKWLISGSILIGTAALGILGLSLFLRGVWLLRRAQREGRKRLGNRPHLHRIHDAHRHSNRIPADEAVGPSVDGHHLLDGRGDLVGYVFNMTMFADVRFAGVVLPGHRLVLYDIFYITPFLAIPYLHTVNRGVFSD